MSNNKSITKHRVGGGGGGSGQHGANQSQNNQRQSDYSRANMDRNYSNSHIMRNNTPMPPLNLHQPATSGGQASTGLHQTNQGPLPQASASMIRIPAGLAQAQSPSVNANQTLLNSQPSQASYAMAPSGVSHGTNPQPPSVIHQNMLNQAVASGQQRQPPFYPNLVQTTGGNNSRGIPNSPAATAAIPRQQQVYSMSQRGPNQQQSSGTGPTVNPFSNQHSSHQMNTTSFMHPQSFYNSPFQSFPYSIIYPPQTPFVIYQDTSAPPVNYRSYPSTHQFSGINMNHGNPSDSSNTVPAASTAYANINKPTSNETKRQKKYLDVYESDGTPVDLFLLANNKNKNAEISEVKKSTESSNITDTKKSSVVNGSNQETGKINEDSNLETSNSLENPEDGDKISIKELDNKTTDTTTSIIDDSTQDTMVEQNSKIPIEQKLDKEKELVEQQQDERTEKTTNTPPPEPVKLDSSCINDNVVDLSKNLETVAISDETVEKSDINQQVESTDRKTEQDQQESSSCSKDVSTGSLTLEKDDDKLEDKTNTELSSKSSPESTMVDSTTSLNQEDSAEFKKSLSYEREFLVSLRNTCKDFQLSENNGSFKEILRKSSPNSPNPSDALLPFYVKSNRPQNDVYRNKSQGGQNYRRPSQPSKNYSDQKSRKIASTSLHSAEYQPSEDAWWPGKSSAADPEEAETEVLLKNVRSTLNKLTPQNYHLLLDQFRKFKIDTRSRLTKVIDLIFDKAVLEPAFVVQYAGFCSELVQIEVSEKNDKNETVKIKFKHLLILKCQETFFQELYSDVPDLDERTKELENLDDPLKKKELEEQLDYERMMSRKRSVGNIKLIAELHKLNMLNAKIMFDCFQYLLKHHFEEYIECLCALITNIGRNITQKLIEKFPEMLPKFETVFEQLERIFNNQTEFQVSSRIRFMIMDLLDLKKNNWIPRRKTEGPKLIAQVHEDMETQQRLKNESINENMKKKKTDDWQLVKRKGGTGSFVPNVQPKSNLNNLSILKDLTQTGNQVSGFTFFSHGCHGGAASSNAQSRSSSTNFDTAKSSYKLSTNDSNFRPQTYHDSLSAPRDVDRKTSDTTSYHQLDRRNDSSSSTSANNSKNTSSDHYRWKSSNELLPQIEFESKVSQCVADYLNSADYNKCVEKILSFCSRECLKKLYLSSEEYKPDIPKYFEYIGEVLGHALIVINKDSSSNKTGVIKEIRDSMNEISGNDFLNLQNSIQKLANEVIPSSEKNRHFNELDEIIKEYFIDKNMKKLEEKIHKNENCSNDDFKSDFFSKLLNRAFTSFSTNNVACCLDNIKTIIQTFLVTEGDQLLFLLECSKMFKTLNNPQSLY